MITVLSVDDEPALQDLLIHHLEVDGSFSVHTCATAEAALERMKTRSYDVIVADYQIPGMDGIAFLKEVRVQYGAIPFILFTGRGSEDVVIDAINNGADFYLKKAGDPPARFAELAHTIRQVVQNKEAARKGVEAAIRESEAKFRALVENALDGILIVDFAGTILFVNRTAAAIVDIGDYLSVARRMNVMTFVAPESQKDVQEDFRKVAQGTDSYLAHYKLITARNRAVWIESIGKRIPFENADAILISIRDVTERKKAEDALRESEEKFSTAFRSSPVALALVSGDTGKFVDVNDTFLKKTGYAREDVIGFTSEQLGLFPDAAEQKRMNTMLQNGSEIRGLEVQCRIRDGGIRACLFSSGRVTMGGSPYILSNIEDITERKKAEVAILQSEAKLRRSERRSLAVSENAGSWIWEVDPDGLYLFSSPAVERIIGYRPAELVGKMHFYDLFDSDVHDDIHGAAIAAFNRREPFHNFVNINCHKNGTPVILKTSGTPLYDDDGTFTGYCGVDEDITERKKTEEALRRTNYQLNLLTGITRHDILNRITVMLGYLATAGENCTDPVVVENLGKMGDAVTTIRSQIEFTRVYQNLGAHMPQWLDIDMVIPYSNVPITIAMNADVRGIQVFTDPMLEKVFFNLLDNSVRHGQRVTTIAISAHKSSGDLIVVWEDNGVGIPEGDKEQIFDRGFGKNSGLGLFLVREILSLTGIAVTETGMEGCGARFEILVPKGTYRLNPDRWLPQAG